MINYEYAELFLKDNVKKQLIIDFDEGQITNDRIYAEEFELAESLCSESELRIGSCEASSLKIKIRNEFGELKGKWLTVSEILNDNSNIPFQYGKYKVYTDELSGDKKYKDITAYDAMHDIINAEMVEWYDGLQFPISIKDFRDSFFSYLGIEQEEVTLIQDDVLIEKTIDADSISGKQIITAICELNGVFGHINRQGVFAYISLSKRKQMIYPSLNGIYPGSGIYPGMMVDTDYSKEEINTYISCEYEDFETQIISKLQIRQEENDVGAIYGTGTNAYIVQDNFLVYGKAADELKQIANRLFTKINGVYYRPFKASLQGNPCVEVGDTVVVHTKYKEVESYVLERTIQGIQALKDTLESKGVYEYAEKVNSANKEVKRLKGKTNKLERTVEMLNSEINDEESGLKSQIKQTAEEITTKVSKGDIISEINQSAEEVQIKGEKISLEGTVTANENFKILKDGSVQAKNGTFEGTIKSTNAEITGGYIKIKSDSEEDSSISLLHNGRGTDISPSGIRCVISSNFYAHYLYNSFYLIKDGKVSFFADSTGAFTEGDFKVYGEKTLIMGDFQVYGTKSRLAKTKSYNDRLLYCYEMPSPIFGDVGHGVIGSDGLCYVDIDQIFFETVDMKQSYQVFLQSYSESNVYVIEKQPQYFVVKGLPNTEFDWEIKAKQLDFPTERLEENFAEDNYEETDYVASASEYLSEYEQEVFNYE